MNHPTMPGSSPVILFDGDCGFCRWTVTGLSRRFALPGQLLRWQSADLADYGLEPEQTRASMWFVSTGHRAAGAAAFAAWLQQGRGAVRLVGLMLNSPPVRAPAAIVYRWVAAHRGKIPGHWTRTCRL